MRPPECINSFHQHVQVVQGGDGSRQVALGIVQLLDVPRYLLHLMSHGRGDNTRSHVAHQTISLSLARRRAEVTKLIQSFSPSQVKFQVVYFCFIVL